MLIVILAIQNRVLESEAIELRQRERRPFPGMTVPSFQAPRVGGTGGTITIGMPPQGSLEILLVLNTVCRFCEQTLSAWQVLADRAMRDSTTSGPFAIFVDEVQQVTAYIEKHDFNIPAVIFPDARTRRLYRANIVPATLILDHDGEIRYARPGLLRSGPALDSLLRFVTSALEGAP